MQRPRTIDELIERKGLPASLDAERLILGSLMERSSQPDMVAASLSAEDFSTEANRLVYSHLVALAEKGEEVNVFSVAMRLRESNALDKVGGLSYLTDLTEGVPRIQSIDGFIRTVQKKATLRKTITACDQIIARCLSAGEDAEDVVAAGESMLAGIAGTLQAPVQLKSPMEIKEAFPDGVMGFFNRGTVRRSIQSPWAQVNSMTLGFQPHKLYLIAARPGVGKSVAACQIAYFSSLCGFGTTVFSLEMPADELLVRIICARAGVESHKFQAGYLSKNERAAFKQSSDAIDALPIWVDDSTAATGAAMLSAVRKHNARHKVDLLIVDYLQLMEGSGREQNRNDVISSISRKLKQIARELAIPVIALSQLNRAGEKENREPRLSDLRESGSLEQDADVVIFLHPKNEDLTDVILAKQRGGPVGRIELVFERQFTRFVDPTNPKEEVA